MSAKIDPLIYFKKEKDKHFACLFFLPRIFAKQAKSQNAQTQCRKATWLYL